MIHERNSHELAHVQIFSTVSKSYVSCTIVVTGVERFLFVAPREFRRDKPSERVNFPDDVIDELERIKEREKITEFQMKVRGVYLIPLCPFV